MSDTGRGGRTNRWSRGGRGVHRGRGSNLPEQRRHAVPPSGEPAAPQPGLSRTPTASSVASMLGSRGERTAAQPHQPSGLLQPGKHGPSRESIERPAVQEGLPNANIALRPAPGGLSHLEPVASGPRVQQSSRGGGVTTGRRLGVLPDVWEGPGQSLRPSRAGGSFANVSSDDASMMTVSDRPIIVRNPTMTVTNEFGNTTTLPPFISGDSRSNVSSISPVSSISTDQEQSKASKVESTSSAPTGHRGTAPMKEKDTWTCKAQRGIGTGICGTVNLRKSNFCFACSAPNPFAQPQSSKGPTKKPDDGDDNGDNDDGSKLKKPPGKLGRLKEKFSPKKGKGKGRAV